MIAKSLTTAAMALAAVGLSAGTSFAWPDKPLRVVVPFEAGGNTDTLARTVQKAIDTDGSLSQPINIANVGGHYSIGAQQVKDAQPDGATFMLMHSALLSGEASGLLQFGFRDFVPVAATGQFCQIPTVRDDDEFANLGDLLGAASDTPDAVVFGVNLGGNNHMAALALQNGQDGAAFRFVQIGGGAANYAALTGGHTQVAVFTGSEYNNYQSSGLKALAYMGKDRLPNLPDIPTASEAGYDVTSCITNYWFAPKGTDQVAVDGFADVIEAAMSGEVMQDYFQNTFTAPVFLRGQELQEHLLQEYERVEPIAQLAKSASK